MPTSWADTIAASENATPLSYVKTSSIAHSSHSSYIPPHLRNNHPSPDPPVPAFAVPSAVTDHGILNGPWGGPRIGGDGYMQHASVGGNYNSYGFGCEAWNERNGSGNRGRDREANPFKKVYSDQFSDQENGGINFDAYEDIPVDAIGNNVPPPVCTFAEIDLGEALNANIRRCKYVKPTPVQRYAIPISLAGWDLMACAQTGSGRLLLSHNQWNHAGTACAETARASHRIPACSYSFPHSGFSLVPH